MRCYGDSWSYAGAVMALYWDFLIIFCINGQVYAYPFWESLCILNRRKNPAELDWKREICV